MVLLTFFFESGLVLSFVIARKNGVGVVEKKQGFFVEYQTCRHWVDCDFIIQMLILPEVVFLSFR